MRIQCECCGRTDIGGRRTNQDHFLIADLIAAARIGPTSTGLDEGRIYPARHFGKLLAVADGLGGHAAGELASRLVIETLAAELAGRLPQLFALATAGEVVCVRELAALADRPLTTDHTLAAQAAAAGVSGPDDPDGTRWEHVLLNCVGANRNSPRGEFQRVMLQPGDGLLLCSDGLVRQNGDEQSMLEIIASADDTTAACDQLVGQAKARGARDNITAVVARFRQAQSDSERGSAESADQLSEPEISRLKSTSDWPQQCVA